MNIHVFLRLGFRVQFCSPAQSQLIRADGSPKYAMFATLLGAVLNCILDPVLIFGLDMGMSGAALATVIGQFISAALILFILPDFKHLSCIGKILSRRYKVLTGFLHLGLLLVPIS